MAKRKVSPEAEAPVVEQPVKSPALPFYERYQNQILYALLGLLALAGLYWGYKSLVVAPQQEEAMNAMWQAQMQFDRDSFKLALENPGGGYDGFQAIADKYGSTDAGNLALYYAGVCQLQLGDFDNAIQNLEKFDADGNLMPIMKNGLLGDLYSEKKDFDKAAKLYEKAVDAGDNEILSAFYLKKLAQLYDYQNNKEMALKTYQRLKNDFPNQNSADWRDIDKYIYRAGGK